MLPRSSKTNFGPSIRAPEDVHPVQQYTSELSSDPASTFPAIDEDTQQGDEDESASNHKNGQLENKNNPDYEGLLPHNDFQEILNKFFVVEHNRLLLLKSRIRRERGASENSFITMGEIKAHNLQALREQYYQLQMVLFRSPKGRDYDTLL